MRKNMNSITPGVKIMLDKERILLLDINGMLAFEDETGISIMNGFDANQMGLKEIRALLWACLLHDDPDLTLQQVGSMLHVGNLAEISGQLRGALSASMPEPPQQEDGDDVPLPESPDASNG